MKWLKSFLTDEDGVNQRDFMVVLFTGLYFASILITFYLSLTKQINPQTIAIIDNLQVIMVTIVGAVFSVKVAEQFTKPKTPPMQVEEPQQEEDFNKRV